jgi:hypothetical protein
VIIQALGTQGVITVYDRQINDISNFFLPKGTAGRWPPS